MPTHHSCANEMGESSWTRSFLWSQLQEGNNIFRNRWRCCFLGSCARRFDRREPRGQTFARRSQRRSMADLAVCGTDNVCWHYKMDAGRTYYLLNNTQIQPDVLQVSWRPSSLIARGHVGHKSRPSRLQTKLWSSTSLSETCRFNARLGDCSTQRVHDCRGTTHAGL